MGRDWRHGRNTKRKYYGSKRFDSSCRCNGACDYCKGNRAHKTDKRIQACEQQIKEAEREQ